MSTPQCKLVINVDDKLQDINVKEITRIDPLMINETLCENPANIAYFGALHSRIKSAAEKQEWYVKKCKAQVGLVYRKDNPKMSNNYIEDLVGADEKVLEQYEKLYSLRESENILYSLVWAIIAQKEELIALSANMRSEMRLAT